ncbi:MAG: hypothetical protein P8L74_03380 [Gammaproteobacteria bacterium]|nr:hypothetical protein [Gammaproteobacteria bacterium]
MIPVSTKKLECETFDSSIARKNLCIEVSGVASKEAILSQTKGE